MPPTICFSLPAFPKIGEEGHVLPSSTSRTTHQKLQCCHSMISLFFFCTKNRLIIIGWSLSLFSEPKSAHLCRMVSFSLPQKILAQKCQIPRDVSVCLSSNLYIPSKRYSTSFSTSIPSFVTQLEYSTLILNFYTQRLFSTSNQYIKRKVCASDVSVWSNKTIQPPPNVCGAPVSRNSEATLPWLAVFSLSLSGLQNLYWI